MTTVLATDIVISKLQQSVPDCIDGSSDLDIWVKPDSLRDVCHYLKESEDMDMRYLVAISAVDYIEYFELVYHLVSMRHNHSLVIKAKCWGREEHTVPSVVDVWRGADFQEREIYDLMGISFRDHPNLKRIMLWEGFPGHPQRKDYFEPPR
ncbi:MAG: NADH-quinone oxidoreductase subunit C [SAR202 cluster bacterium]|nr:NADH-quinone oxidoreductase subunit C [SAR202 cluster bacterium]|tara:strand:- start:2532 stop:2984 length:453 start_codon:yes stop_codon:yes gene_type:complete